MLNPKLQAQTPGSTDLIFSRLEGAKSQIAGPTCVMSDYLASSDADDDVDDDDFDNDDQLWTVSSEQ